MFGFGLKVPEGFVGYMVLILLAIAVLFCAFCPLAHGAWGSSPPPAVASDIATGHPIYAEGYNGWYTAWAYGKGWEVYYNAGHLTQARRDGKLFLLSGGKWVTTPNAGQGVETLPVPPAENFGVDPSPNPRPPGKYYKGEPITRADAIELIDKADLPDETKKVGWLVFIGPKSKAKEVQAQLDAVPGLKAKVWFQSYDPAEGDDHKSWPASMYASQSHPKWKDMALYLECLDGSVCHGQYDLKPGDLKTLEQNWKPEAAPDIRDKSTLQKIGDYADENPGPVSLAAAGIVWVLHLRRRQKEGQK